MTDVQKLRCAIYVRFSSEMQSPSSVDDQERECREYAAKLGWEVVLIERDAAVRAGASAGRLGYQSLLARAREGGFQVVLVEEISRFSRDFLGGFQELAGLREVGVQVADTKTGLVDLDSMAGQIQAAVNLAQSQAETKRLGERSKRGLRGQTEKKYSSGGRPAYGLKREPEFSDTEVDQDGRQKRVGVRFVQDPATAPIVRRIFDRFDAGETKSGIARRLNEEGIPTRDAGRVFDGVLNSGTWTAASIKRMLENPIYIGKRLWNTYSRTGPKLPRSGKKALRKNKTGQLEVESFVEPIVEQELWERVQARLAITAAEYKKRHAANPGRGYLLSGLIICATCGRKFAGGRKRRGEPHYRCGFRASRGATVCENTTEVSRPGLERKVRYVLDIIFKDPKELEVLVVEHNRRITAVNDSQQATVQALRLRKGQLESERARLVEAVKLGGGELKVLVDEMKRVEGDLTALEEQIAVAQARLQPLLLPNAKAVEDFVVGRDSIFEGDQARDRQFLERVLEGIFVYADGTIVLRFQQDSLFAPVRAYEFHPDRAFERGTVADRWFHGLNSGHAAGLAKVFEGAELRVVEQKGGPRFRLSALRSPPLHTVSVPRGI